MTAVGVVLAAGRGERFARADPDAPPKMLARIDGVPMIRRTVDALLAAGIPQCLVVVAPDGTEAIGAALHDVAAQLVVNPDPDRGMFSSVQCGVMAAGPSSWCVLLPGDMPFVRPRTIAQLVSAAVAGDTTVVPRLHGHRGHPVVCSARLRTAIASAGADARLDRLLAAEPVTLVDVVDPGVRRDVDLPDSI